MEKGKISNRTVTCVSIDSEKLKMAKERHLNISLLLDGALSRELLMENKEAYQEAIEKQNKFLNSYITHKGYEHDLDKYKYEGGKKNVLEEEERSARENREDKGHIGDV